VGADLNHTRTALAKRAALEGVHIHGFATPRGCGAAAALAFQSLAGQPSQYDASGHRSDAQSEQSDTEIGTPIGDVAFKCRVAKLLARPDTAMSNSPTRCQITAPSTREPPPRLHGGNATRPLHKSERPNRVVNPPTGLTRAAVRSPSRRNSSSSASRHRSTPALTVQAGIPNGPTGQPWSDWYDRSSRTVERQDHAVCRLHAQRLRTAAARSALRLSLLSTT
jgi:hypothetical protein